MLDSNVRLSRVISGALSTLLAKLFKSCSWLGVISGDVVVLSRTNRYSHIGLVSYASKYSEKIARSFSGLTQHRITKSELRFDCIRPPLMNCLAPATKITNCRSNKPSKFLLTTQIQFANKSLASNSESSFHKIKTNITIVF